MTLLGMEGFDSAIVDAEWALTGGSYPFAAAGRNGNGYRVSNSTAVLLQRNFTAAEETDDLILGFAYRFSAGPNGDIIRFTSDAGATTHVTIRGNNTGFTVYRGLPSSNLIGTTPSGIILPNIWTYMEFRVKMHDTLGVVEVWQDGVRILNLTAQDTKNAGTKTKFDGFQILGNGSYTQDMDDMYWASNDGVGVTAPIGDVAVETLLPNADGTLNQFVGSDGNSVANWQQVDDATMVDYNESANLNDVDEYNMANMVRTTGTIYGIQATAIGQKSDSGPRGAKIQVDSGGTVVLGTELLLATGVKSLPSVMLPNDPHTSAAWTFAGVNAVQVGTKVTT